MAPEVIEGGGASTAVDFWSFGVLLYEMTLGHTPFAGPSMQETFSNIVTQPLHFPPKHSASREVPPHPSHPLSTSHPPPPIHSPHQVVDLIKRLLVKDPTRRPTGALQHP